MMKMGWMQISIVYRHLDLWPGCEKGKWYLLHMITTLLLYATLFWEDFSIFWGKLHAFLYMVTLLVPIKRHVIQLFLPHRTCVQVWCTIFSKIFEVHDDYRGLAVGRHVEPCCL